MTLDARLVRRVEEHRLFASFLPDVARRRDWPRLRAYVLAIADYNVAASIGACDSFLAKALARIEEELPSALEELGTIAGDQLDEPAACCPPALGKEEEDALFNALVMPVHSDDAEYRALFDVILAHAKAGRLPTTQPELSA